MSKKSKRLDLCETPTPEVKRTLRYNFAVTAKFEIWIQPT